MPDLTMNQPLAELVKVLPTSQVEEEEVEEPETR